MTTPSTPHLDQNGTGLAHVVEQLVIEIHYSAGHGPQLDKPAFEVCPVQACVVWRRFLTERMPD
jgi:hypothetical protein